MKTQISYTITVIPYFNEEPTLLKTCNSLGFGLGSSNSKSNVLVLVNNNSKDKSSNIAKLIRDTSTQGTVHLIDEKEQGIVVSRHSGNLYAQEFAKKKGVPETEILIIQADGDTIYSNNYILTLKESAEVLGLNHLIEAETRYPTTYINEYPLFLKQCEKVDSECESFFVSYEDDVIVDDKTSCYFLSDYFIWGGHKRRYHSSGDEIYAETTQLFISAKISFGTRKVKVASVNAAHSIRNILEKPILTFVTAGFPRENNWVNEFLKKESVEIISSITNEAFENLRRLHLAAIFCILPAHVNHTMGLEPETSSLAMFSISRLPKRNSSDNDISSLLIEDTFRLIQQEASTILDIMKV